MASRANICIHHCGRFFRCSRVTICFHGRLAAPQASAHRPASPDDLRCRVSAAVLFTLLATRCTVQFSSSLVIYRRAVETAVEASRIAASRQRGEPNAFQCLVLCKPTLTNACDCGLASIRQPNVSCDSRPQRKLSIESRIASKCAQNRQLQIVLHGGFAESFKPFGRFRSTSRHDF